jgi:hypothetical protein
MVKQNGVRPEWKERQARKRVANIFKQVLGVVFLIALIWVGVKYKDQILNLFKKETPPAVSVVPLPPPPPPPPKREVVPPAVVPPKMKTKVVTPVVPPQPIETFSAGEIEAANKLIESGVAAMEKFDFDGAGSLFGQAAQKKCGPKLKAAALTWQDKAANFKLAIKHIHVSEYAEAETSYIIKTTDGTELCGLVKGEDETTVKVQQVPSDNPAVLGKMTFPLPRSEIEKQTPVSREERSRDFRALLGTLEASSGEALHSSTDYYDLVYLSRRLNLGKECIAYLNRAYDGNPPARLPDHYVGDSFRKLVVAKAIERATMMLTVGRTKTAVLTVLNDMTKTLPDFQYATEECEAFKTKWLDNWRSGFKPALASSPTKPAASTAQTPKQLADAASEGEAIEVVVDNSGLTTSGPATALDKANAKYEEGMKFYSLFKKGNADNNKVLKQALVLLDQAVDLYSEVLKREPNNLAVQDRQTSASMMAYACRKYQTM